MPLDFTTLTPRIERLINLLKFEYSQSPGLILTEDDLKCLLHNRLSRLAVLRGSVPTRERHILGSYVHAELSWYDENRRLRIKPDITIVEPEHMSVVRGHAGPTIDPFCSGHGLFAGASRLPSKQYEIGGKAVTLELKFARSGINRAMLRLIEKDFEKMMRLFEILDRRGEGGSLFSYLVIFNKRPQRLHETPLADFMREHGASPRHRILYRAYRPRSAKEFADRGYCGQGDLVITDPPYFSGYAKRRHRPTS